MKKLLIAMLAASLTACGPSVDTLSVQVRGLLQKKLDEPEMAEFHLKVDRVTLIHEDGHKYEGIATIEMDGTTHDVPVHVVADGDNMMYQTDSGAFLFAAQAKIKKALAELTPDAQPAEDARPTPEAQALMDSETVDYGQCRGGSGDSPETTAACERRDVKLAQIKGMGWCWGHKEDVGSNRDWVRCTPDDL